MTPRTIKAPASLDREWVTSSGLANGARNCRVTLDMSAVERIDSAGVCLVNFLPKLQKSMGGTFNVIGASEEIEKQLAPIVNKSAAIINAPKKVYSSYFERVGEKSLEYMSALVTALSMLVEMIYWSTIGFFKRQDYKRGALLEQMFQLGYKAVGIIALLSFLIGFVLALQSALLLRPLGLGIFLIPLIGIAMIAQLGPLLTAIIIAGRTGSATTAEVATMVVGEEIDALRTMGINPMQYVMAPKFWAISLTMPLLSIVATASGIFGGYIVSIIYLEMNTSLFMRELVKIIKVSDILSGCFKSIIFAWLIIWIGCYFGFKVRGGAEAVGRETTSSVVVGIFVIIAVNALLSFVI